MNEPQVWTLIGVFSTLMFTTLGIMTTMFTRVLDAKFDAVDAKFDAVKTEIAKVSDQVAHLDRNVQALAKRVFERPE